MARRTASALAMLSAMVTASVMFTAQNANADLVMYCVGSGGAVTVPSDLFVPAGESCSLDGTTITGNVRVAAGGNLIVKGVTINGEVRVASDGYLDTTDSKVGGQVVLAAGGFGIFMRNTDSGRVVVQPKGTAAIEGFLFVEQGSKVTGNVNSSVGEVRIDDTEVTGSVSTSGAYFTDLHGSFVDGTLSVLNNASGSVVCGSAVQGNSTFSGNQGGVQIGPNGGLDSCASGGYFARDVSINNTTGRSSLDDNIINGKLDLSANSPATELAANNRIRGGVTGEHTGTAAARSLATEGVRGSGLQRAQERLAAATGEASATRARL